MSYCGASGPGASHTIDGVDYMVGTHTSPGAVAYGPLPPNYTFMGLQPNIRPQQFAEAQQRKGWKWLRPMSDDEKQRYAWGAAENAWRFEERRLVEEYQRAQRPVDDSLYRHLAAVVAGQGGLNTEAVYQCFVPKESPLVSYGKGLLADQPMPSVDLLTLNLPSPGPSVSDTPSHQPLAPGAPLAEPSQAVYAKPPPSIEPYSPIGRPALIHDRDIEPEPRERSLFSGIPDPTQWGLPEWALAAGLVLLGASVFRRGSS